MYVWLILTEKQYQNHTIYAHTILIVDRISPIFVTLVWNKSYLNWHHDKIRNNDLYLSFLIIHSRLSKVYFRFCRKMLCLWEKVFFSVITLMVETHKNISCHIWRLWLDIAITTSLSLVKIFFFRSRRFTLCLLYSNKGANVLFDRIPIKKSGQIITTARKS